MLAVAVVAVVVWEGVDMVAGALAVLERASGLEHRGTEDTGAVGEADNSASAEEAAAVAGAELLGLRARRPRQALRYQLGP